MRTRWKIAAIHSPARCWATQPNVEITGAESPVRRLIWRWGATGGGPQPYLRAGLMVSGATTNVKRLLFAAIRTSVPESS